MVEFVLSTMLPRLRPVHKIETSLDIDEWKLHREASVTKLQFNEITLGIIGFGRVGSRLGSAAKNLGFRVLYYDLKKIESDHGCLQVELKKLLEESNVVSVHVDGRLENNQFICADLFSMMKPDLLFINTSRGFVVHPNDLTSFLVQNSNAFAILDVHDPEPFTSNYPLLGVENVSLYPHIAAKTDTALHNMGWVVKDVELILRGEEPIYEASV